MKKRTRSARTLLVERYDRLTEVDAREWDGVVARSRAPVFYRTAFLDAYERSGLGGAKASVYLVLRDRGTGEAEAVLPLYLLPEADPLGLVPAEGVPAPAGPRAPALLSHCWHCYDTQLPGAAAAGAALDAVDEQLRCLARELGAELFGFVDVGASNPLGAALAARGYRQSHIQTRYQLRLDGFAGMQAYLASLSRNARKTLLRDQRRAAGQGVRAVHLEPVEPWLGAAVELCRRSAAKFGNQHYYPAAGLAEFLRLARPFTSLIGIERDGVLIAVSISLVDGDRFHTWAGGADYESVEGFSPNWVLVHEEIAEAIDRGAALLEGGRGNGSFKLRLGMTPEPVHAYLAASGADPA